jgi:hypothetical protein
MPKQAISVTLEVDNLAWVRGRAVASARSVSDMLDRLIEDARSGGTGAVPGGRSVVGTVTIAPEDPELLAADGAIRALFARSLARSSRAIVRARAAGPARRRAARARA